MPGPRITIITPCLNQAPFIERTICSVLDQGYDNLEYLVVDGGSTDGSAQLIRRYQQDIDWSISQPDEGPADAINRALRHATGDIVGILPGDDVYLPGALDTIARVMAEVDSSAWVIGDGKRIGEYDESLGELVCSQPAPLGSYLKHETQIPSACVSFFRRDVLRRNGWFDRSLGLCYEYEYHCRLLAEGIQPHMINARVAGRREHPGQRSSRYVWRQGVEQLEVARRYAVNLPLRSRIELWRNCDERELIYALAIAESLGDQARRFLLRRLVRRPWWAVSHALRHALRRGIEHPAPPLQSLPKRQAA